MLNKKFIQGLKKEYDQYESERRQIISLSNTVLHDSKRVIFALHRDDFKKAEQSLVEIEKTLGNLEKKFGHSRLAQEGSYRAGAEEYVEAKMFYKIIARDKIDKIKKIKLDCDNYLGGFCDVAGELVRRAINKAAAGDTKEAERMKEAVNEIMSELVEFDMTGYLRTKYDQAKGSLRKIEQVIYEISTRK